MVQLINYLVLDSPEIDKLAGIQFYCTKFSGIGGSIKNSNKDFKVSELVDKRFLNSCHLSKMGSVDIRFIFLRKTT